ncbi:FAD/NAD(P)-binding domain-containing protein [Rhizodiscina lignyota]|uniref:FAD/NAD(P)-binding domain-containing protein n=1 Tax=Rhizodiscina lignyota TaxID=1504668 RepID=A0A9P4I8Y1_9PEZI|nr:FAD/NAD(P)-binding domain-containing protein [Rhizodiscina lignyota]
MRPAPFACSDEPARQPRRMRIVCIGAGMSGIAASYKFQRQMENAEFVIYEKNEEVSGTWWENRYKGCACDLPAHSYTFSWEGNPNWSRFYAGAEEIFEYYKGCAERWGCMKFIKLKHRVTSATWNESSSTWKLLIENRSGENVEDEGNVLISATGVLNQWRWPSIEGLHDFGGKLMHSARWDDSFEFHGKRVAVIGAGSSAIQIVPAIQGDVSQVISFIRSSTWITAEFAEQMASNGRETIYTPEEIERFNTDKAYFLEYRKRLARGATISYDVYRKDSALQKNAVERNKKAMRERLSNRSDLCEKVIPSFEVGCRRLTPGSGYLEALAADNSKVVFDTIERVNETGIVTKDGSQYDVDAIVCATGFDVSQKPAFPVMGRNGVDLRNFWKDAPIHYLSVAVPDFPNYFIVGGPNSTISNGSLIYGLEAAIDYAFKCTRKMQEEGISSMTVRRGPTDEFLEYRDALMQRMVWSGSCRSWYKNGKVDGPVTGPWCGSTMHYRQTLNEPRWEDYDIRYIGKNRFAYLGMGRIRGELEGNDMASILTDHSLES